VKRANHGSRSKEMETKLAATLPVRAAREKNSRSAVVN